MSEFPVVDIAQYLNKEQTIGLEGKPVREQVDVPRVENLPRELVEIAESVARTSGTWNPVEIYTADADSLSTEQQKVFDIFMTITSDDDFFKMCLAYQNDQKNNIKIDIKDMDIL